MISPHALPRLGLGVNRVEYCDDSEGAREITLMHCWQESDTVLPPLPPQQPLALQDGAAVAGTTVPFAWRETPDASRYWIQVSRYPDMRLPYRPCFDVIIDACTHEFPFAGLFNPHVPYYWRVRPRNRHGVWGRWSPVWRFTWQGPRVPVAVNYEIRAHEIHISWKPNPAGCRPVRYEVYGSNERGFTLSKCPYEVYGLGEQTASLLGITTDTQLRVVSAASHAPGMNCSFYRVVAVDANDVAGGPSALIELPHPFIYSRPLSTAQVGTRYQYPLKSVTCLGDLQYRYAKPNYAFWEAEGCEFELVEGPVWLKLEPTTKTLTGTPGTQDVGMHHVTVVCRRTYPKELKAQDYRSTYFLKDEPRFAAETRQIFELQVQ